MAKSITSFNANEPVVEILNEIPKGKVTEFINNAILEASKPKITHEVPKLSNVRVKP